MAFVKRFLVPLLLLPVIVGLGCSTGLRRRTPKRPPRKIYWDEPVSVVRGFLSAKRTGDWRKAYRCCDYDETLPKPERAGIKKKWKAECKRWPAHYATTFWAITGQDFEGENAAVRILVSRRNPLTGELRPGETYQEILKKYKGKWKITNPLAQKSSQ